MAVDQCIAIIAFFLAASLSLLLGAIVVFLFQKRLSKHGWPVVPLFLISFCLGSVATQYVRAHPKDFHPACFSRFVVVLQFPLYAFPLWQSWTGSRAIGPLLHVFSRRGELALIWIGRSMMIMMVLAFLVLQMPGMWTGWWDAIEAWVLLLMIGTMGYRIAEHVERLELGQNGVLRGDSFRPWNKLGKFEWVRGNPPELHIQNLVGSDIRVESPEDPKIDAILTDHGLVRS